MTLSKFAPLTCDCRPPLAGFSLAEVNHALTALDQEWNRANREGDLVARQVATSLKMTLAGAAGNWAMAPEGSRARAERHLRVCKALGDAIANVPSARY